jgi:hypothetical protein
VSISVSPLTLAVDKPQKKKIVPARTYVYCLSPYNDYSQQPVFSVWRFLHGREFPANIRSAPANSAGVVPARFFRAAAVRSINRASATYLERSGATRAKAESAAHHRPAAGCRYRMEEGEIQVDSIQPIGLPDITPELARESGFLGVLDLLKIAKHG